MALPESPVPGLVGEIRGRLGTTIYARNTYGPYAYQYSARTDPDTLWQRQAREWFSYASARWKNLSQSTRDGWETYARNVRRSEPSLRNSNATGFQYFTGMDMFNAFIYSPYNYDAPTTFTLGRLQPPSYANFAGLFVIAYFALGDSWRFSNNGAFALFTSRPQTANVNHFKGPFRYSTNVSGSPSTPPTLGFFPYRFLPTPTRRRIFLRARVVEGDNRLSPENIQYIDVP